MNPMMNQATEQVVSPPPEFTELVRGNEGQLMDILKPVIQNGSTVLDMSEVHRIDAAGIAALISLYGSSRNAGYSFRLCNVTPHVEEILKLVGLDHVLVSRDAVRSSINQQCYECPAA